MQWSAPHFSYFALPEVQPNAEREAKKENPDSDQTQISVDGGMFMHDVNTVDRMLKFVIQKVDRIQDSTNLEDEIIVESQVHEEEVAKGLSSILLDEELDYDALIRLNNNSGEH
ncbi:hypothetical protein R6Q57_015923 [Mikania cordata]